MRTAAPLAALALALAACSDGTGPSGTGPPPDNGYAPQVLAGMPGTPSGARAINASGQVAGSYTLDGGVTRAYRWTAGQVETLAPPGGDATLASTAVAISDAGWVAGASQTAGGLRHATLWRTGQSPLDVGTLDPGLDATAFAVNASGEIAGAAFSNANETSRPFRWTAAGGMQELPTCASAPQAYALGINASGTIAGYCFAPGGVAVAVAWTPSLQLVTLPTPARSRYSLARAVNDAGVVVGAVADSVGEHPAAWVPAGPGAYDLVMLKDAGGGAALSAIAIAVNGKGEIVGRIGGAAVYWSGTGATSQSLSPLQADGAATPWAINDAGVIAGETGTAQGTQLQAVRWQP